LHKVLFRIFGDALPAYLPVRQAGNQLSYHAVLFLHKVLIRIFGDALPAYLPVRQAGNQLSYHALNSDGKYIAFGTMGQ